MTVFDVKLKALKEVEKAPTCPAAARESARRVLISAGSDISIWSRRNSGVVRAFPPLLAPPVFDFRPKAFFMRLAAVAVMDLSGLDRADPTLLALKATLPQAASMISYAVSRKSSSVNSNHNLVHLKLLFHASNPEQSISF